MSALMSMGRFGPEGRIEFLLALNDHGEYVLAAEGEPLPKHLVELDAVERTRLAASTPTSPYLVVAGEPRPDGGAGDFVVLVDTPPVLDRHVPLGLDDAEIFAGPQQPVARFGRREEDVLVLTPWLEEHPLAVFDPDDEAFAQVPLVTLTDGELAVERGELDENLAPRVKVHLLERGVGASTPFGVLSNPFGEFVCIPVGALIAPHEDVRSQAILRGRSLMDGARSLSEAALRLRVYADRLEAAEKEGWTLVEPVKDDFGFPERHA